VKESRPFLSRIASPAHSPTLLIAPGYSVWAESRPFLSRIASPAHCPTLLIAPGYSVWAEGCLCALPATTYLPRGLEGVKMALLMTLGHLMWAGRCPWAPLATTYLPRNLATVKMAPADCGVKESRPLVILGSAAHSLTLLMTLGLVWRGAVWYTSYDHMSLNGLAVVQVAPVDCREQGREAKVEERRPARRLAIRRSAAHSLTLLMTPGLVWGGAVWYTSYDYMSLKGLAVVQVVPVDCRREESRPARRLAIPTHTLLMNPGLV
jgi:hypothetical protein